MRNLNLKIILCLFATIFLFLSSTTGAIDTRRAQKQNVETDAESLKALFIIKFSDIILWPDNSDISNSQAPFVIGFMGKTPIKSILMEVAKDLKVKGKNIRIISVPEMDRSVIKLCNVLFIAEYSRRKISKIMELIKDLPVLTIGSTKDYEKKGVMINLLDSPRRIKFNVNCKTADKSGITLTSKLVRFANSIIK